MWIIYELMLLSHVKFYTQNVCQIRKTRIEIRVNIVAYVDAYKVVRFAADD